jgi:hypothetical protein
MSGVLALGIGCRILGERVLPNALIFRRQMAVVRQDLRNHFPERLAASQPLQDQHLRREVALG